MVERWSAHTPQDRPCRTVSAPAEMPLAMSSLQLQNGNKLLAQRGFWRSILPKSMVGALTHPCYQQSVTHTSSMLVNNFSEHGGSLYPLISFLSGCLHA